MTVPSEHQLIAALRAQGMPPRQAQRMAGEWLDHCEDVRAEAGYRPGDGQLTAIMGSVEQLTRGVEHYLSPAVAVSLHRPQGNWALVGRWTGACTGGLVATLVLFVTLSQAIAI